MDKQEFFDKQYILAFILIILIVGCYYYKRSKNLDLFIHNMYF